MSPAGSQPALESHCVIVPSPEQNEEKDASFLVPASTSVLPQQHSSKVSVGFLIPVVCLTVSKMQCRSHSTPSEYCLIATFLNI